MEAGLSAWVLQDDENGARGELLGERAGEAADAARRQQRRAPRNGARRIGEGLRGAPFHGPPRTPGSQGTLVACVSRCLCTV